MTTIRRVVAPNPGPYTLEGTNTWLVGEGPVLVIDPGPPVAEHVAAVTREAGEVAAILLSHRHPDHAPAAAELARRTGAPVFAFRPNRRERRIEDGQEFEAPGGRLVAIHTPGHTPDHVAFFDPESGALFTGDAVLGRGTSVIDPPEGDLAAYLSSLERMLRLGPSAIHPGHGPVVADGPAKLEEYIRHRRTREQQVMAGLREGPRSPRELVPSIYEGYPEALHPAAARSVLAHLLKLEREGRVRRVGPRPGQRHGQGDGQRYALEPSERGDGGPSSSASSTT